MLGFSVLMIFVRIGFSFVYVAVVVVGLVFFLAEKLPVQQYLGL